MVLGRGRGASPRSHFHHVIPGQSPYTGILEYGNRSEHRRDRQLSTGPCTRRLSDENWLLYGRIPTVTEQGFPTVGDSACVFLPP